MWVRTQNRQRLINTEDLGHSVDCLSIYSYSQKPSVLLGTYATPQRALEVLDEMQATLIKILKDADNKHEIVYVYEMPKD